MEIDEYKLKELTEKWRREGWHSFSQELEAVMNPSKEPSYQIVGDFKYRIIQIRCVKDGYKVFPPLKVEFLKVIVLGVLRIHGNDVLIEIISSSGDIYRIAHENGQYKSHQLGGWLNSHNTAPGKWHY